MYVDSCTFTTKYGKIHTRHLLRTSHWENGKVTKKTIANITHLTQSEINALKYTLSERKNISSLYDITKAKTIQGRVIGVVYVLQQIAQRLNILKALGNSRNALLALWLCFARLINQGSRLSSVRLANIHAACEVLNIDEPFNEDTLYDVLDWCTENQEDIERRLFESRYKPDQSPRLYLYDVTSSYFEGKKNEYADYGYNRDGKKGKKQIVLGLLTDQEGWPISVKVFRGNTSDQKTITDQIKVIKERFNCKKVTLVGDRGMIKNPQIEELKAEEFSFITAITKSQIESLVVKGIIQIELFDEDICEVECDGLRYILRRNPIRCKEIRMNREDMLKKAFAIVNGRNKYLSEHSRANPEVALRTCTSYLKKRKLDRFTFSSLEERKIKMVVDVELQEETEKLDGCYVLKTDLEKEEASKEEIHQRYKSLFLIEKAFKNMKTEYLQTRPIYVRKKERTEGHIFITMLSYMISKYLREEWININITVEEGIAELSTICVETLKIADIEIPIVPEPRERSKELLAELKITLPNKIPERKFDLDTRKKLQNERNLL